MFRIFFTILLSLSLFIANAQEDFKALYPNGNVNVTGQYIQYKYENPNSGLELKVKKKYGEWLYYYEDGQLKKQEFYSLDKKGWDRREIPVGTWKYYNPQGNLTKEEVYEEKLLAYERFYLPQDSIKEKHHIYEDGNLVKIENKTNNVPTFIEKYKQGRLQEEIILKNQVEDYKKVYVYNYFRKERIDYFRVNKLFRIDQFNEKGLDQQVFIENENTRKITKFENNTAQRTLTYKDKLLTHEYNHEQGWERDYIYEDNKLTEVKKSKDGVLLETVKVELDASGYINKEKYYSDNQLTKTVEYIDNKKKIITEFQHEKKNSVSEFFMNELINETLYTKDEEVLKRTTVLPSGGKMVAYYNQGMLSKQEFFKNNILYKEYIYQQGKLNFTNFYLNNEVFKTVYYNNDIAYDSIHHYIMNGNFEQYSYLPNKEGKAGDYLKYWKNPTQATPDYFHYNSTYIHTKLPNSGFGFKYPRSENACIGLYSKKDWKEYLQVKLIKPLTKDHYYQVKLYISNGEKFSTDTINDLGVLLYDKEINMKVTEQIDVTPQVLFKNINLNKNMNTWTPLKGCFKADGTEKYLIIGFFNSNDYKTYYFIDDISLVEFKKDAPHECSPVVEFQKNRWLEFADIADIKSVNDLDESVHVILRNIQFDIDKADIKPVSYPEIEKLIGLLNNISTLKIEISGHTDNTGTEEHNLELSEKRANAVRDYLISKGIDASRVTAKGFGSNLPIAGNESPEGRAQNRRVEFVISTGNY